MSFTRIAATVGVVIAFASKVAAHGTVTGIVADGVYYPGYYPNFQYLATQPVVVGWSVPGDLNNGFIAPDAYTTSDIICHVGATNAQTSATVSAGGSVELQWTVWRESHHGPVIDYLANCNGDCTTVDKTTLEFFKIDGVGLVDDTMIPGSWASDTLIANNNSWTVTIPSDIAPGNYVLRHEIIALHSAGTVDGAQNYPQCVNLEVTGSGTATPAGVLGTALYTETDPGIEINIYQSLSTYVVPGPTLYSGAISASQTGVASVAISSASVSSVATSAPISGVDQEVTSTAAGVVPTSISSVSAFPTSTKATSGAPYLNTTLSPTRSRKPSPSSPSSKTSAISVTSLAPVVGIVSTTETLTSATETETLSVIPVPSTSAAPSDPAAIPAGTKLSDLLSWIAAFYNKFKGTSYTDATIARRHARDVAARQEIEKYDVARFAATGTKSGFARPTGCPHGTGFFGPRPTGVFPSGVPLPTEARHFVKAEFP